LLALCLAMDVKGSLLLAGEGMNGTIAGQSARGHRRGAGASAGLAGLRGAGVEGGPAEAMPFGRMKVKLKREIVTMGVPGVDPRAAVGALRRARPTGTR
jgi:UPF0176 protein